MEMNLTPKAPDIGTRRRLCGARGSLPMQFTETDLHAASSAGVIDGAQLTRLVDFLGQRAAAGSDIQPTGPRFDMANLLWYAGALIVIGAMGLFSTLAFSQMGGQALAITAVVYAAVFSLAGHYLWTTKQLT